jgi:MFS family permease
MTQAVAQSWLVFRLTGHAVDLGLLGIVTWGPVLAGAAWGGALADRLDRRHLMMATQALFIVVNVIQAGLVASGRIQLWMIFVLGALNGAVNAVDSPARQVYVFQLVGRQRLASAVGLFEGLRLVRHHPEIRFCVLIALAGAMLFDLSVSAPPFASRALHLGGGGYGALMAAFGFGALPGALVAASAGREPDGRRLRTLTLLTGLAVVATALSPVVAGAFLGLALSGFLSIWLIAAASTLVQLRSEPRLRGRIMGIWTMRCPAATR